MVCGDMKAVIRAVLTDPEARGAGKVGTGPRAVTRAKPVLVVTQFARAMNAQTDGVYSGQPRANSGQTAFILPSAVQPLPARPRAQRERRHDLRRRNSRSHNTASALNRRSTSPTPIRMFGSIINP